MDQSTRSGRAYIGWVVVAMAVLGTLVLLAPVGAVEGEADESVSDPDAFAATSYANNCTECHGSDGGGARVPGTDRIAPAIDEVDVAYLDLVLRTGRMPPPGDPYDNRPREIFYTDAERRAMVDWMTQRWDLPGEVPEVGEGDVAQGLETYALHCAHCHGNTGAGGTAGQGAWTPQVNHLDEVAIAEAIRVGPFEMPAFSADLLDDQDVADVAAYLRAVDEEGGTPVLGLVELNPVFASGFVGLLAVMLIGSLLYIGGRPVPFEPVREVDEDPPTPAPAPTPSEALDQTPVDPTDDPDGQPDTDADGQSDADPDQADDQDPS